MERVGIIQLEGLKYIRTFTIEEYKAFFKTSRIDIKINFNTNLLFFTDSCRLGEVAINDKPINPVIGLGA